MRQCVAGDAEREHLSDEEVRSTRRTARPHYHRTAALDRRVVIVQPCSHRAAVVCGRRATAEARSKRVWPRQPPAAWPPPWGHPAAAVFYRRY